MLTYSWVELNLAQAIRFDGLRRAQSCKVALAQAVHEGMARARAVSLQKSIHSAMSQYNASKGQRAPFLNGTLTVLGASSGPEAFLPTSEMSSDHRKFLGSPPRYPYELP